MLTDSFTSAQDSAQSQRYVYQAIEWMGNSTSPESTFLSVSDWRFTYSETLISRNTLYQFESSPQSTIPAAKSQGIGYIIVTFAVTESLLPNPSLFPWNNFKPSANLTMVYSNPDVEIFEIS